MSWAESPPSWQWGSKTEKGLGFKFSYCQYFRCHGATLPLIQCVCASLLERHTAYCSFHPAELCVFVCSACFLPQRVKYCSIVPDPEQLIGRRDPVRVGVLGVPKDGVGQPDQTNHIADWMRDKETERERERKRQKVKKNGCCWIPSDFSQTQEADPLPNKRIIKLPGDTGKTKHINQFVPLITGLFPGDRRILFSNEIFTVWKYWSTMEATQERGNDSQQDVGVTVH